MDRHDRAASGIADVGFRALFDALACSCLVLDAELRIVAASDRFLADTGTEREVVVGRSLLDVVLDEPGLQGSLERVRRDHVPDVMPVASLGGRHLRRSNIPVLDDAGELAFVVHRLEDVTDVARLEEVTAELRARERRWQGLLDAAPDAMVVVDARGRIRFVNRQAEVLFRYEAAELIDQPIELLVPASIGQDHVALRERYTANPHPRAMGSGVELTARRKDGSEVPVEISLSPFDDEDDTLVTAAVRDVTERKRLERALSDSEKRFRATFEGAPIGIALTDLHQPVPGRWTEVNAAFARTLGHPPEDLVGRRLEDFVHPDDLDGLEIERVRSGQVTRHEAQARFRHADGHYIWVRVSRSVVVENGEPQFAIAQFVDVTAQRRLNEQLAEAALHDALTGLPNRSLLMDRVAHQLADLGRSGGVVAVLYLDIDRFKQINDSLGHDVGDAVLVEAAARLRALVRPADTAARLGGDEFVAVVSGRDDVDVITVATRVEAGMNGPVDVQGRTVAFAVSAGVAVTHDPATPPADLLRDADVAMYAAKARGGGRVEIFDASLARLARDRREGEDLLREAVDRSWFRVHYQPVVDLRTGDIACFEALLRLEHPSRGLLDAHDFIAIADRSGLIHPIGAFAVQEACRQLAAWETIASATPRVAVNLSGTQIQQGVVEELVLGALADSGATPSNLCIEVTESVLMGASAGTIEVFERLRDKGIELALDDFGTGYSSFSHLRRFPVSVIKIDRAFTTGLGSARDTAIVGTIVELGRKLDLTVVAEGVETTAQLELLRDLGCPQAQGHLFAPPLDAAAATLLIGDGARPRWFV